MLSGHKNLKEEILKRLKKVLGSTYKDAVEEYGIIARDKLVCDIVEYIESNYERKRVVNRPD